MGRDKEEQLKNEQAAFEAAQRENRRCIYCDGVIPFGENPEGQEKICGSCYNSVKSD